MILSRLFLFSALIASGPVWADAAALMSIVNPASNEARPTLRLDALGFAADDFAPAQRIAERWTEPPSPRSGRNLAIAFARLDASQSWGGWSIGMYRRLDAFGETTQDTVRVYYEQQSNPEALTARSGRYDLNYYFRGFSADGLRLAWSSPEGNAPLRFGGAINLLKAGFLRIERANGTVSSAQGVANVNGRRELIYSGLDYTPADLANLNDFSPSQQKNMEGGLGYALDLGLEWVPRDGLRVSLAANDLLGCLSWRNVPKIRQDINNANWPLQFNAPSDVAKITGDNTYENYTLRLKPKVAATVDWSFADWTLGAGSSAMRGLILPEVSAGYVLSSNARIKLSYEPRFGSAGLELHSGPVFVSLRSDRLSSDDAHAVGVEAGLAVRF